MSAKNILDIEFDDDRKRWYKEFKILEEKAETECDDVYERLVFWQKEYEKFRSQIDSKMMQASGETLQHYNSNQQLYLDDFISHRIKSLEREKELLEETDDFEVTSLGTNILSGIILPTVIGLAEKTKSDLIVLYLSIYCESPKVIRA